MPEPLKLRKRPAATTCDRAAVMYTLIGTALLNDVNPEAYLRDVLERIAELPANRVDELLPWNVKEAVVVTAAA